MSRVWTVKTLTVELQRSFDRFWPRIVLEGEVGQIQVPRSGHCYFQLREGDTTLGGVMWKTAWQGSRFRPEVGQRVRCTGKLGLFGGKVQLYTNVLEPAGEGWLQQEIRARTERLRRDGLLDPGRKRALPRFPRVVGVATSADGAAIADFLRVSGERFPAARILVAGCKVQGPEAPASVVRALELLWEHGGCEVIVVTRGGGSKEDLLAFMDETLARAIASSPVPVVSAVGHEIDTTLADLVADAVAPTPSAAANVVFPDRRELARWLADLEGRASGAVGRAIDHRRQRVDGLSRRLRHPRERVARGRSDLQQLRGRLERAVWRGLDQRRDRLAGLAGRLDSLSPLRVLQRGYAVARRAEGALVTDAASVAPGDRLTLTLARGALDVVVEGTGRS
ncbi:MAG: exodeoxyribonuclease VII large subunit [Alphaproteobacteria bacterium]|nr:exodeoxyribonuclease VII large subunit [Alphaproteobacteria bacterium]